jgi:hypothetical protein
MSRRVLGAAAAIVAFHAAAVYLVVRMTPAIGDVARGGAVAPGPVRSPQPEPPSLPPYGRETPAAPAASTTALPPAPPPDVAATVPAASPIPVSGPLPEPDDGDEEPGSQKMALARRRELRLQALQEASRRASARVVAPRPPPPPPQAEPEAPPSPEAAIGVGPDGAPAPGPGEPHPPDGQ